jgi:hypothetical protein
MGPPSHLAPPPLVPGPRRYKPITSTDSHARYKLLGPLPHISLALSLLLYCTSVGSFMLCQRRRQAREAPEAMVGEIRLQVARPTDRD